MMPKKASARFQKLWSRLIEPFGLDAIMELQHQPVATEARKEAGAGAITSLMVRKTVAQGTGAAAPLTKQVSMVRFQDALHVARQTYVREVKSEINHLNEEGFLNGMSYVLLMDIEDSQLDVSDQDFPLSEWSTLHVSRTAFDANADLTPGKRL